MFHYFFNALPRVTNALPYALPYYNSQFLQYQHMTFFCATSDVLLFMLLCILKGISTYLYHFQRVTTRYRQFY